MNQAQPLIQALLDDLVADDPVLATRLGLTVGADRLPSWSASALSARVQMLHGHEARLRQLLGDEDTGTAIDAFAVQTYGAAFAALPCSGAVQRGARLRLPR